MTQEHGHWTGRPVRDLALLKGKYPGERRQDFLSEAGLSACCLASGQGQCAMSWEYFLGTSLSSLVAGPSQARGLPSRSDGKMRLSSRHHTPGGQWPPPGWRAFTPCLLGTDGRTLASFLVS